MDTHNKYKCAHNAMFIDGQEWSRYIYVVLLFIMDDNNTSKFFYNVNAFLYQTCHDMD